MEKDTAIAINDTEHLYCACYVCGLLQEHPSKGEICACCGVEFGYTDATYKAVQNYRHAWLAKGAPWSDPSERPEDWNLAEQMSNIPKDWLPDAIVLENLIR